MGQSDHMNLKAESKPHDEVRVIPTDEGEIASEEKHSHRGSELGERRSRVTQAEALC